MPDIQLQGWAHALARVCLQTRSTGYGFVTPTPATHARVLARDPAALARDLRDVFGWSRPFAPGLLPPGMFDGMQAANVVLPAGAASRSSVRFSTLGPDLFAHSAYPTVGADAVFFGPDTYRFCAAVTAALPNRCERAIDICAGAGPGAITIAHHRPGTRVLAADINLHALELCRVNAAMAGVDVAAVQSDLLDGVDGEFDLIVANPPYLNDSAQRTYRHGGGRFGEALSLRIVDAALPRLRSGGRLVLYTGVAILDGVDPFRTAIASRLEGWRGAWQYREIDPDVFGEELEQPAYAGVDRIAAVVLIASNA